MSREHWRKSAARHGKAAFTLVEILVAVALSSVIMMALFGMFGSVVEVASSVKLQEDSSYGERTFEGILFDDLRSIYRKKNHNDFKFVGSSGSFLGADGLLMGFSTSASLNSVGSSADFSLQRVEYVLGGDSDSKDILRREKSYCGISGDWEWIEVPILKGITDIEFEYLDPLDDSMVTEWNSASTRFPKAVYVRVTYPGKREYLFVVELSSMARNVE